MTSKIDNITSLPDIKATPRRSEAEIRLLIDQYIDKTVKSATRPPHAGGIEHFFELVQNAIWSRQATESIPEAKRLLVMAEDVPEEKEVDTEAITFYLDSREPGAFSRMSVTRDRNGVKEVVPHIRSIQQHPEHLGEKLVTMGRFFDNTVVFNIYSRSEAQSMKRLLWFEDVMDSFRWYFGLHFTHAIYMGARRIGKVIVGELPLAKYSVSYLVRTEDTFQFGSQELVKVALNVNVSTN